MWQSVGTNCEGASTRREDLGCNWRSKDPGANVVVVPGFSSALFVIADGDRRHKLDGVCFYQSCWVLSLVPGAQQVEVPSVCRW